MQTQLIPLNITVVNFSSFITEVEKQYYNYYVRFAQDGLTDRDSNNLYLYFTYKTILDLLNSIEYKKNVVFYIHTRDVSVGRAYKAFTKLQKTFPIISLTDTLDFSCLQTKTGESKELINLITDTRFNFDYSEYPRRKMLSFLRKYQIKLPPLY